MFIEVRSLYTKFRNFCNIWKYNKLEFITSYILIKECDSPSKIFVFSSFPKSNHSFDNNPFGIGMYIIFSFEVCEILHPSDNTKEDFKYKFFNVF